MGIRTLWDQLLQDFRYGRRMLAANPLFAVMAALSLALGIGANTAIYSFMDAILVRALPVQRPESLVVFNWHTSKDSPAVAHSFSGSWYKDSHTGTTSGNFPFPAFELFRANNPACSTVLGFVGAGQLNLIIREQADLANGQYVSGEFFSGLGVPPAAGRLINPSDDRFGVPAVVVLSFAYWQKRFGHRPNAVGESILINNTPFTIAGISAPEFYGVNPAGAPDVFLPMHTSPLVELFPAKDPKAKYLDKNTYWVEMMGRLRPGVSIAQAQSVFAGMFQEFVSSSASTARERETLPALVLREGATGLDHLRRQYSKPLYVLVTLVGMILAIACANVANLLLARAAARRREMAVRLSLGASRLRVVRQLLTESVILASVGGAVGVLFAIWGVRFLTFLLANGRDNFTLRAELNWRVLGVTIGLSLATGLLFGLAPAIQAARVNLTPALKASRSEGEPGAQSRRWFVPFSLSQVLLVSQIAASLLLLVAAGLFVRTLSNLQSIEVGFNRENVLLFNVNAKPVGYRDEALARFYDDLRQRLAGVPGVRSVTLSNFALVSGSNSATNGIFLLNVGPSFFTTMQIPILLGREIDERDRPGAPRVAVVNEVFARKYFAGQNPVGQRFAWRTKTADTEIIGVSKTARYSSLKVDIPPIAYVPYAQELPGLGQVVYELRTSSDPLVLANTVRQIVHEADSRIPVTNVKTQSAQIDQTIGQERMFARLCTCFAVLALVIACVGLYGSMAYSVARRTSEIGIRMALGAQRRGIIWMVLRRAFGVAAVGIAAGLAAAYATGRLIASFLFGMKPHDPLALSLAVIALMVAAAIAAYAPAWRASRIDPMSALRQE